MIRPVVLWTDALFYLLVVVVLAFVFYARRQPQLRASWRRVFSNRLAAASSVILLVYVVVGLLDSLHFRLPLPDNGAGGEVHYAVEVLSVLDYLLGPVRTHTEKTYSAPMATRLYTREFVQQSDGAQIREYPRLEYGGRQLRDPARDFLPDVFRRASRALLETVLVSALLLAAVVRGRARRHRRTPGIARDLAARHRTPTWVVVWFTASALLLLFFLAVNFAAAYHVFGTDKVGQDVFYQSLKSIRTGLMIGTLTTLVMLPFAVLLGILAGYTRGWIDDGIQYVYTTLNSIPHVLLIAAAILMLQVYIANHPDQFETGVERADIRLLFLCIILGITSWTGLCRLLRGEALISCRTSCT